MFNRKNKDNDKNKDFVEGLKAFAANNKQKKEQLIEALSANAYAQITPEDAATLMQALTLFNGSTHDPEDCLFLSLTQREVVLLGFAFNLFRMTGKTYPLYAEMLNCLDEMSDKIAEAMTVQKAPHLAEGE